MTTSDRKSPRKGGKGFRRTSTLVMRQLRDVGEAKGFAVSRVLTHWDEIAGPDLARTTRPVDVRYGRQGLGATLTILTTGAQAPLVEMQKDRLRERVNACYGYAAISQIRITQTAATGFAEGQVAFTPAPAKAPSAPSPEAAQTGHELASGVEDEGLRVALGDLAANILSKSHKLKGNV